MKVRQISVFLENRKGRLYEVCSLLGEAKINIRALTIAETESFGVLRMVVNKPAEAIDLFRKHHITANLTDVVAVEVPDRPGGLAEVLKVLANEDMNVEYMYGFVEKATDKALMVFKFENIDKAISVLKSNGINIVDKKTALGL